MADMNLGYRSSKVDILSDVSVPKKYYDRVSTGVTVLDQIFGGDDMPGIPPFMSILLTGCPGAGKTTMTLQLADMIQKNSGKSILYNCGEQNKYVIKMCAERMALEGEFAISQFGDVEELTAFAKDNCVEIIIQDSLQTLSDGDLRGAQLIKSIGGKLAKFADENNVIVLVVGQITKGGQFAGPMMLKHALDAHAHLSYNKDTGNRVFELTKNRFGPAMVPYEFHLGQDGLNFSEVKDPEENTKRAKGNQRKEAIKEKAKEMLLNGAKLSGYSSLEHNGLVSWLKTEGYEISGAFWRGVLTMAATELERNGHIVKTERINRREHVFVEV